MPLEIIPKQKSVISFNSTLLRYIAGIVLFVTLGIFAVLFILYNLQINRIQNLQEELGKNLPEEQQKLIEDFSRYARKSNDYIRLAQALQDPLVPIEFLQDHTHKQVSFSSGTINLEDGTLNLQGQAQNFKVLQEQLLEFRAAREQLLDVEISNIAPSNEEGFVSFNATLTFFPNVLDYE